MDQQTYIAKETAILLTDPYNDFMTPGGKLYDKVIDVAKSRNAFANIKEVTSAARSGGIRIFILPHHRAHPNDYADWDHVNPMQATAHKLQAFAAGSWGGEWADGFEPQTGDVVMKEHWGYSGFASTDLDQQLKQHGIRKLICIGMIANACVESTARYGMELGYHVTLVKDATSAFTEEAMRVAHDVNAPFYAHAVLTTAEVLAQIQKVQNA